MPFWKRRHLCPGRTLYARGLCFGCYYTTWRADRLADFPRSQRGVYRIDTCAECVTALRVEVSSAMRINAFVGLAKRLDVYFEEVLAAIELGISNALIEGINAKIRLINARGYGHHSAQTLASMIYLCLGGLQAKLPTTT